MLLINNFQTNGIIPYFVYNSDETFTVTFVDFCNRSYSRKTFAELKCAVRNAFVQKILVSAYLVFITSRIYINLKKKVNLKLFQLFIVFNSRVGGGVRWRFQCCLCVILNF